MAEKTEVQGIKCTLTFDGNTYAVTMPQDSKIPSFTFDQMQVGFKVYLYANNPESDQNIYCAEGERGSYILTMSPSIAKTIRERTFPITP